MSNKQKHLEVIEGTINRMANTSFILKGWAITITVAILGFIAANAATFLIFIGIAASIIFYLLDSYYLYQERLFRCKYNEVRKLEENDIDFSMSCNFDNKHKVYFRVLFSFTEFLFYLSLIAVESGMAIWLYMK